jgi:hypothetical protein
MCASGILMSALTLALILTDIYNDRMNYIAEHAILGGVASILFFTMCSYGFEIINWVILAIIPITIFFKWLFSEKSKSDDEDDGCGVCEKPKKKCGCPEPEPEKKEKKFKEPRTCPAKGGMKIGDACGVSRFT